MLYFTQLQQTSFHENVKERVNIPANLVLHYFTGHVTLQIDTCNVHTGCFSLQKQSDNTSKPAEYRSFSLTDAEKLYDTTQREYLVIL